MIYSPIGADDMHRTSRGDDMPSLREPPKLGKLASGNPYAAWIKKSKSCDLDFLAGVDGIEPSMKESKSFALPLGDTPT